jgi:osmotically-inducible protein OsmY
MSMSATAHRVTPSLAINPHDEALQGTLERHPYLRNRNLRFESRDGRVILRGKVNSYYQKVMAQEIVRRLEGVDEIENQLEVTWS